MSPGMRLLRLRLTDVRCHRALEVEFGPFVTVLVGPNGAGKTTVIEAAALVLRGSSPRTAHIREALAWGSDVLRVEADLAEGGVGAASRTVTAALGYAASGERRLTADGAPLADTGRWEEFLPLRVFLPDDLRLVKGSPRRRRDYLDSLASAGESSYLRTLARFEEALQQRNTLLRRGVVGGEHEPWEALIAREGLRVVHSRARALRAVAGCFTRAHALLAGGADPATLSYRTNVADLDEPDYRLRLAAHREADRQRSYTHLGPQRDDLRILVGGRDVRDYGSQGEQRTALLALLLGESALARQQGRRAPLLLLDDVMSELDHDRRRALVAELGAAGQVVVTTTDLHYFTEDELRDMRVVKVGAGETAADPPPAPAIPAAAEAPAAADPPARGATGG